MKVSIVGTGYVGLSTGALLAAAGHKVYCIDVDQSKIDTIKTGKSYFFEPGLDNFVKLGIDSGNLIPTLDYSEAIPDSEVAIISVGTPQADDGSVDLKYIFQAANSIKDNLQGDLIVVQKSTVPVGTGRELEKIFAKTDYKVDIISCPEFLAQGSAVLDTLNMDRFVVGSDSDEAKDKIIELFSTINDLLQSEDLDDYVQFASMYRKSKIFKDVPFKERVLSLGLESAELIKVTANAFLASKISFANYIAQVCDQVGANVNEVMEGIGMDERIGRSFLYAGLGWGGGCFPKDVEGLIHFADSVGVDFKMLKAARDVNFGQVDYSIKNIKEALGDDLKGKTATVLGLSFKPGTSDVRQSPAIELVTALLVEGMQVKVYDPKAMDEAKKIIKDRVYYAQGLNDALENAEITILATDWPDFNDIDFADYVDIVKEKNLFDARNRWDRSKAEEAGFKFYAIGR
ncbi:UDP-glucose/GDP-mannose dehydrogenase family protein [Candidatus Dojkabacteria bacterium]|uniref:UDP-glucose 6-dehydrogenase n=1 Tax=Candidatus Dojkabacteria bacterium TaxID=2099670 RepID=A0A955L512_9BACT|nr:UDP-glucose/GDP-mannose dehydrogenase family protein [Candidatus Dojkabacteria bacterium]